MAHEELDTARALGPSNPDDRAPASSRKTREPSPRIGLIDVEEPENAARILQTEGFRVGLCPTGLAECVREFSHVVISVRQLDRGLARMRELRAMGFDGSIIIVSRQLRRGQELLALRAGASECVRSPPDWIAIAARFRHEDGLRIGSIPAVLSDRARLSVIIGGPELCPQDRRILRALAEANGQPVDWDELLDDGVSPSGHSRHALETAISALRGKLGKYGIRIIKSAAGWWLLF